MDYNKDVLDRVVLYACTSGYPVPHKDVCLLEITRLKEEFGKRVEAIGFSGHHLGIAVDMAAITLGAEWIERHAGSPNLQAQHAAVGVDLRLQQLFAIVELRHEGYAPYQLAQGAVDVDVEVVAELSPAKTEPVEPEKAPVEAA